MRRSTLIVRVLGIRTMEREKLYNKNLILGKKGIVKAETKTCNSLCDIGTNNANVQIPVCTVESMKVTRR